MSHGLPYGLYRTATHLFQPAVGPYLARRLRAGKEETARLAERKGLANRIRPPGPLAWVHGASVGEALAVLPLVERLVARGFTVLVTTGTVSSAAILATRLPAGAFHQFIPLDVPAFVTRFLSMWRPDIAIFAESELWPNLMVETARRGIPLVLVNARLSQRSFDRWRRLPGFIGGLLRAVTLCLAQSEGDAVRLQALGARHVGMPGNLKFDAAPPPADWAALDALRSAVSGRPVWLAASTHADEEPALLDAHCRLAPSMPGLLTIVVPRQTVRGAAIAAQARGLGLSVRRHAAGEPPDGALFIGDTMGELGLFFRMARAVFMGKSLAGGGGQNPIEPGHLGCAVLHGPQVANFAEVYAALDAAGGAWPVSDAASLAAALETLLHDATKLAAMGASAQATVAAAAGATDRIMGLIDPLLAPVLQRNVAR